MGLFHGEDELQLGGFGKGSVVKVSIGKDTVKAVCIAIARLVQQDNGLEGIILVPELGLKDVGDLSFRLSGDSNYSGGVLGRSWLVDEFTIMAFCLEGGVVGEDMARGCLAHLGEAEYSNSLREYIVEGEIACLNSLEKFLSPLQYFKLLFLQTHTLYLISN